MTARSRDEGGFTLVETLVAVAVVALVSVALQRGFVSARVTLARAEATIAGEAIARGILETRLDDLAPSAGVRRGVTDGKNWTVTSERLDLPFAAPPPPPRQIEDGAPSDRPDRSQNKAPQAIWTPLRVTIEVAAASGPALVVETVHLARAP